MQMYRTGSRGGHDFEHRRDRLRTLILLMRWSGLAIKDAVTLERTRLSEDGNLFLYRAKTGVPVYVPLPPEVHTLLHRVARSAGFVAGDGLNLAVHLNRWS
jgi:integrase/recombinase XerD